MGSDGRQAERGRSVSFDLTRTVGAASFTVTSFGSRIVDPIRIERSDAFVLENARRIGAELFFTGRQRLEENPFLSTSRDYVVFGILAERRLGPVRVFVNTDGHRLRFVGTDDMLTAVVRAVLAERQCCRFLQFTIVVAPDEGPITLDLTGPPGTREFMATMLES